MKEIPVSQFKAHALETMRQVNASEEPVLVLRHGKPLVEIHPAAMESPKPGKLAHTLVHMGDIVSPLGADDWEAAQ